jgi:hypothetical protein
MLMYRAGQAAAGRWVWPVATLFSSTLALILGIVLSLRPAPPVVYVAVPAAPTDEASPSPPSQPLANQAARGAWSRYIHLQEDVLLHGLDGLPSVPNSQQQHAPPVESLWDSL